MAKTWAENTIKKLRPITKGQVNFARKNGAKFIFVNDKEGHSTCQYCEQNVILPKSKHLAKAECPNCGKELTVQHTWRMKKHLRTISWTVVPKVIDNTLVLRYILATSCGAEMLRIKESARMIINENHSLPEYWCYNASYNTQTQTVELAWKKTKVSYFTTPSFMFQNAYFCMYATEYPRNFFKEINKLDCFKYYPVESVYDKHSMVSQLHYLVRSAKVNEKLSKIGMENIHEEHLRHYMSNGDKCITVDNTKTKLVDILKMDKEHFNEFKKNPTFSNLQFYQTFNKLSIADCNWLRESNVCRYGNHLGREYMTLSKRIGVTIQKFYNYVKKQGTSTWEIEKYYGILKKLGYNLKDLSYALPKDFHKAYKRVNDEIKAYYEAQQEAKRAELRAFEQKKNELLGAIQRKLREMPELQEFFSGKNGYMVSCPASVEEFINEGREQHNCVGSMGYDTRVAENKTLIFFIRELNNPNASFVTMEYCHGTIVQCMFDHNQRVGHDTKVYSFAEALADTLRANNILVA